MTLVISSTFLLARPKVPSCVLLAVFRRESNGADVVGGGGGGRLAVEVGSGGGGETYPLLRKTTGTLVLGVAEEFDDALLVGSETVALLARASRCGRTQLKAAAGSASCAIHRTPPPIAGSSTYPATSRVISLTNAVRLDRNPFLLEILAAGVLGVTSAVTVSLWSFLSSRISNRVSNRCVGGAANGQTYCGQR